MREGRVPVAPHVVKFNGQFYMSGNNAPLYRASAILGPYEVVGDWTDASGKPFAGVANGRPWVGAFDVDIFVDEDNTPYLYFPGRSTEGIYAVPLDPHNLNRFMATPTRLFEFDPSHVWERYGEMNEYRGRVVDRGALDDEAQGHLLLAVQCLRHAVAVVRDGHVHEQEPDGSVHLRAE